MLQNYTEIQFTSPSVCVCQPAKPASAAAAAAAAAAKKKLKKPWPLASGNLHALLINQ
jgi:hypothetical protein